MPKRDASVILLSVPCSDDLAAGPVLKALRVRPRRRRMWRSMRRHSLACRRVVPEGLAEGQQLSFRELGGAPQLGLGMSEGFGPVVSRGRRRPTASGAASG